MKQTSVVRINQRNAKRGSISVTVSVDFDQADAESVRRAGELIGQTLRVAIPREERETFLADLQEAQQEAIARGVLTQFTRH